MRRRVLQQQLLLGTKVLLPWVHSARRASLLLAVFGPERESIPTHSSCVDAPSGPLVSCSERCHLLTRIVSHSENGFSIIRCPHICARNSPHSGHGSHMCSETHDPDLDGHPSRVIAFVHPPSICGQVSDHFSPDGTEPGRHYCWQGFGPERASIHKLSSSVEAQDGPFTFENEKANENEGQREREVLEVAGGGGRPDAPRRFVTGAPLPE